MPLTSPLQFLLPLTICMVSRLPQPTSLSMGMRFLSSMPSDIVNVTAPPCPPRTPLVIIEPGNTMMTLVPMLATRLATAALAPSPILTIAITAPTPITIPSMVSPALSRLRLRIRIAVNTVSSTNAGIRPPDETTGQPIECAGPSRLDHP